MLITSKSNEKVKFVKSLNEKKFRQKNNAYYLEGLKVTYEILNSEEAVNILFIAYSSEILLKNKCEKFNEKELLNLCLKKNIQIIDIAENIFKDMCETVTPQGILCVIKNIAKDIREELIKNKEKNVFILDGVQDPGNIGTIVRNAVAFDIKNIICLNNTTDVFSPKSLRSTMGTILKVNVFYAHSEDEIFKLLKDTGYCLVGTSLSSSIDIDKLEFDKSYAFILGNEANGVRNEVLEKCEKNIKIKMTDKIDSLNVSVASGIIGYYQYINKK